MHIKKGTIVSIRKLNKEILKNKSSRDVNIINNTVKCLKSNYLICLRKVDDTHFLCAYIRSNKCKRSIPIKFNLEKDLWVNYAHFIDINSDFLQIEVYSNEYLFEMVSKIYAEHNVFVEESKEKKKERQEKKRKELLEKRQFAKEKKYKKSNLKVGKLRRASTKTSYSSTWWNVNHPVSGGRGNF